MSRGIDVLRAINQSGPLSLSEIVVATRLPHSTVVRIIHTLELDALVRRQENTKRYGVTEAVLGLSCGFNDDDRLSQAAHEPVRQLTRELGWPVTALTRVGGHMVARTSSVRDTSMTFHVYDPGVRIPIFGSAAGRVYWAYCDAESRAEILTNAALSQPEVEEMQIAPFRREGAAEAIRSDGYVILQSVGTEERLHRNAAIAVPILVEGKPHGVLSLVFFARALTADAAARTLLKPLAKTAELVAGRLNTNRSSRATAKRTLSRD